METNPLTPAETPRKRGRPFGSKTKNKKIKIVIPYKPREWAKVLHTTHKRWIVLVVHRRAGKTVACINHLQRDALRIPLSKFAYIAPTYKQAKNVAWDLVKYYSRNIPGVEYNEVELTVRYPNGAKITLYGADNPDSLRGIGLHGVVFDEYSQQPGNIFTEIIRPALADNEGYAIWIGTPKGRNEFYRIYKQAKEGKSEKGEDISADWLGVLLTSKDTNILSEKELQDARKTMSEDEFNQEFMCSFEAAVKGAYYSEELSRARMQGRIAKVPHDPRLPVYTVWDLGIGDATAIGFYQKAYNEVRMVDYYENTDKGLLHYLKVLKKKEDELDYYYGAHFAPHDIEVRELSTGVSRLETAQELGINFEIVPKLSIEDGINAGRLVLNRMYLDEDKCSQFLDALSQYQKEWDDRKGLFKDKPKHDWTSHAADVHRYMAIIEKEFARYDSEEETFRVESKRRSKHSGE